MQTTSKDGQHGASITPPPATNGTRPRAAAEAEGKKARAKREWFVTFTLEGKAKIANFDSKPAMFHWLNNNPTAPKYGEFEIIVGTKVSLRQTVSLG